MPFSNADCGRVLPCSPHMISSLVSRVLYCVFKNENWKSWSSQESRLKHFIAVLVIRQWVHSQVGKYTFWTYNLNDLPVKWAHPAVLRSLGGAQSESLIIMPHGSLGWSRIWKWRDSGPPIAAPIYLMIDTLHSPTEMGQKQDVNCLGLMENAIHVVWGRDVSSWLIWCGLDALPKKTISVNLE